MKKPKVREEKEEKEKENPTKKNPTKKKNEKSKLTVCTSRESNPSPSQTQTLHELFIVR
jgi:hypothetical protein